ncbi:NAD(P)H-binding protein [Mumia sp. zg.B53]|uniref:NmrA family NAD(P)-binding protein n=1 Tax=Mumia sp. zg.B53 TaxID=2855449 RepID=UPI001C6DE814|nr:NAD(P)H-binding protein [Mumia sp. zg.B53]MBW9214607.1 NAD(P)H-binding protein [Mumia sp. zg.B53]
MSPPVTATRSRIAVMGSTGRLGGQVVRALAGSAEHEVVALARTPAYDGGGKVQSVHADYDDPDSLRTALVGVDTLVFVSSDGEAARMMTHHRNVVEAIVASDVAHVVYLSGLDVDLSSPFCYAYTNGTTEELLARTGCGLSVVRASIFTEFFAGLVARARPSGELRLPAGDAQVSLVSREDVARCLAALATTPTGRSHDVTGPVALGMAEVAEVAERAWGTPVSYVDVPPTTFGAELAASGEDPWWTYAYASLFASIRQRRWEAVSEEVRALTGRAPSAPSPW